MTVGSKLKKMGKEIAGDPGVLGGLAQIFAAVTNIVIRNLSHRSELPAPREPTELIPRQ